MTEVGLSHVVPYVWMYPCGALEFSELKMSTPTCARLRPNRRTFAIRKSTWLMRSTKSVCGGTRFTVTLAAPPDKGRPSVCATCALGTTRFAIRLAPGRLWIVELTWTSTFGMVYDISPLNCVAKGATVRQNLRLGESSLGVTSHVSVTARPVLVPPWNIRLFRMRPLMLTSTPCQ